MIKRLLYVAIFALFCGSANAQIYTSINRLDTVIAKLDLLAAQSAIGYIDSVIPANDFMTVVAPEFQPIQSLCISINPEDAPDGNMEVRATNNPTPGDVTYLASVLEIESSTAQYNGCVGNISSYRLGYRYYRIYNESSVPVRVYVTYCSF